MSTLNLPVLSEVKKAEIKIPVISCEPIPPEITQEEIFMEKQVANDGEIIINSPEVQSLDIKPVKPKRKMSEKQLNHLKKMRENRAAIRKKKLEDQPPAVPQDPRSPTRAPRKDGPARKAEPPAGTPKPDNFYEFMNYMEKYKSIKKSWRDRDNEKRAARGEPAPKGPPGHLLHQPPKKAPVAPVKQKVAAVTKPVTNVLNIKKNKNPYSSYF